MADNSGPHDYTREESTTASLPLDPAPREVQIARSVFVFTGTGIFGTRRRMQDATIRACGFADTCDST